jgi:hypothetical protein
MKKWVWVYIAGFIALTGADFASTILGIAAGASEFNHTLATSGGDLKIAQFFLVNAAMLAFTSYMLIWAWRNRLRIDSDAGGGLRLRCIPAVLSNMRCQTSRKPAQKAIGPPHGEHSNAHISSRNPFLALILAITGQC